MAWAGIVLGMIAGMAAAVLGCVAGGLPLWAGLLIYPAAGTAVALLVITALAWRSAANDRQQPELQAPATA